MNDKRAMGQRRYFARDANRISALVRSAILQTDNLETQILVVNRSLYPQTIKDAARARLIEVEHTRIQNRKEQS